VLYRRKILLALIDAFGGSVDKLRLQKMLFLLSQQQERPCYEFVPYKYGGYSFTASRDIHVMHEKGYLREDRHGITLTKKPYISSGLKSQDLRRIYELCKKYQSVDRDDLLREVYWEYPYYAISSEYLNRLGEDARRRVEQFKPKDDGIVLFTIGYEGRSLENYFNELIKSGVKSLIDVRYNPVSMKPGFSKRQLEKYCEKLGIAYKHIPEVGVVPQLRKHLKSEGDYYELFTVYRHEILTNTLNTQREIVEILRRGRRIALTCFEFDSHRCHRSHLAEACSKLCDFDHRVVHL
jgi:uncharacterized protein (DUF488 family)